MYRVESNPNNSASIQGRDYSQHSKFQLENSKMLFKGLSPSQLILNHSVPTITGMDLQMRREMGQKLAARQGLEIQSLNTEEWFSLQLDTKEE